MTVKLAFIIAMVLVCLSACKTIEYVPVESERVEYRTQLDSIYLYERDSIYIHAKADTVWVEKWSTRYRDVLRIDTLMRSDTIRVPHPVHHYYEPTWWERVRLDGFYYLAGVIVLWLLAWVARKRLRL